MRGPEHRRASPDPDDLGTAYSDRQLRTVPSWPRTDSVRASTATEWCPLTDDHRRISPFPWSTASLGGRGAWAFGGYEGIASSRLHHHLDGGCRACGAQPKWMGAAMTKGTRVHRVAARLVSASVISRPLTSNAPTRTPADVPTIASAPAKSTPTSRSPVSSRSAQPTPTAPPPPRTRARVGE
jgi:hypothetical protein